MATIFTPLSWLALMVSWLAPPFPAAIKTREQSFALIQMALDTKSFISSAPPQMVVTLTQDSPWAQMAFFTEPHRLAAPLAQARFSNSAMMAPGILSF